jgi:hypothetical protein
MGVCASGCPHGHTARPSGNKTARLPYMGPSTEYARMLCHLQAPAAPRRAKKIRAQSCALGMQGVGGSAAASGPRTAHGPFGGAPPPPQPRRPDSMSASIAGENCGLRPCIDSSD